MAREYVCLAFTPLSWRSLAVTAAVSVPDRNRTTYAPAAEGCLLVAANAGAANTTITATVSATRTPRRRLEAEAGTAPSGRSADHHDNRKTRRIPRTFRTFA